MHPVRDNAMISDILWREQTGSTGKDPAFTVRGHPSGHHERHTTARTLSVEFRYTVPVFCLFQPGMHRAHENAVFQRGMPKLKRTEQVWVAGHGSLLVMEVTFAATRSPCHAKRGVKALAFTKDHIRARPIIGNQRFRHPHRRNASPDTALVHRHPR